MRCSKCNREIETGFFCTVCGAPLIDDTEIHTAPAVASTATAEANPWLQTAGDLLDTEYPQPAEPPAQDVVTPPYSGESSPYWESQPYREAQQTYTEAPAYTNYYEEQLQPTEQFYEGYPAYSPYENNTQQNTAVAEEVTGTANYYAEGNNQANEKNPTEKKRLKTGIKVLICIGVVCVTVALGALFGYLVANGTIPWFKSTPQTQSATSELTRPEEVRIIVTDE